MKYNAAIESDVVRAREQLEALIKSQSMIEIKKVQKKRSLSQNNYFYLLLDAFGSHWGYTQEEAKTIFKRDVNPRIFVYEKNGSKFLRSSADLTKEEMIIAIDKFREYSAEQGYPLPLATDQAWIMEIQNAIEANKRYL